MFGESESESPRTGSPWDNFLSRSDPASPSVEATLTRSPRIVPKLVPEVEEGNVEYKLRLLNPTAERFTRLVTQLKWRLLEGGGEAYYELGVADSGQLVGLSRAHLTQSLQTLEEMAGEIGASVIVVKEIELSAAMVDDAADRQRGRIADGAMRMPKMRVADYGEDPSSVCEGSATDVDEETESSATEGEDELGENDEGGPASVPDPSPNGWKEPPVFCQYRSQFSRSVDSESYDSANVDDCGVFAGDLEIASVYKPRPHRRRTPTPASTPPFPSSVSIPVSSAPVDVPILSVRRLAKRSKKHHNHKRTLNEHTSRTIVRGEQRDVDGEIVRVDAVVASVHMNALDDLEQAAALLSLDIGTISTTPSSPGDLDFPAVASRDVSVGDKDSSDPMYRGQLVPDDPKERRVIVEALIVRKMSLEEVFLDFVNL